MQHQEVRVQCGRVHPETVDEVTEDGLWTNAFHKAHIANTVASVRACKEEIAVAKFDSRWHVGVTCDRLDGPGIERTSANRRQSEDSPLVSIEPTFGGNWTPSLLNPPQASAQERDIPVLGHAPQSLHGAGVDNSLVDAASDFMLNNGLLLLFQQLDELLLGLGTGGFSGQDGLRSER